MARTLPWLKEQSNVATSRDSRARPAKRQRIAAPASDEELENGNEENERHQMTGVSTPSRLVQAQSARANRTPSTSPPPSPSPEDFMREGLKADDIYIMVEDEFLAVAQSYTTHLHHAEYQRLKTLARSRNAATTSDTARPDSLALMSKELRLRKTKAARAMKQKQALGLIVAGKKKAQTEKDNGAESGGEIARDDDPWVGTTLQGLMTSPSRRNTSLVGLQGVPSTTRAAAGYSKPKPKIDRTQLFDFGPTTSSHSEPRSTAHGTISHVNGESTASDDDDLDKLPTSRVPQAINRGESEFKLKKNAATRKVSFQEPPMTHLRLGKEHLKPSRSFTGQDSVEGVLLPTFLPNRKLGSKAHKEEDQGREKANVNEIPIFLV